MKNKKIKTLPNIRIGSKFESPYSGYIFIQKHRWGKSQNGHTFGGKKNKREAMI